MFSGYKVSVLEDEKTSGDGLQDKMTEFNVKLCT